VTRKSDSHADSITSRAVAALRSLPPGSVRSAGQLAKATGMPITSMSWGLYEAELDGMVERTKPPAGVRARHGWRLPQHAPPRRVASVFELAAAMGVAG
jgi:hypothetical protein